MSDRVTRAAAIAFAAIAAMLTVRSACADHEAAFYPSFYPQEIRIETLAPGAAAAGWPKARVHAYVGDDPFEGAVPAADASSVESLRSLVVLTFDASPGRSAPRSAEARCHAARDVVRSLEGNVRGFVVHPYPVTPWHADYLDYADLAADAQARVAKAEGARSEPIKIRAIGALAQALLPSTLRADAGEWAATLEAIDVDDIAATESGLWLSAPWVRQGWFQARALFKDRISGDAAARSEVAYRRLVLGDYADPIERINLARSLVSTLADGCERVVVGYALRREYVNSDYSNGVENVAFDAQGGFASRIFPRTLKLKDFPWNGWLRIATSRNPAAAWNPVAGMTDPFGRLLWLAMSDPALLPDPYGTTWITNRVNVEPLANGRAMAIPPGALRPEYQGGRWQRVGTGKSARQALRYSVITSAFHDGTAMNEADVLYAYLFAYRHAAEDSARTFDPVVARSTATMREWLAGIRPSGTRTLTRDYGGDLKFSYRVLLFDVYLAHRSSDLLEAAAAAPPWSTLPWHVLVLMDEAVQRGIAALSQDDARRRGIAWLDLVRDREASERLVALVDRFRDEGYRPAALASLVSTDDARARWSALRAFHDRYGHFLVTNGPYRLDAWSPDAAVLAVFRDPSYPQGVGAFDDYAIPRHAYVAKIDDRGDRLEIGAEVERISRFQRSYELSRGPVIGAAGGARDADAAECRYRVIAGDKRVVRAGTARLAASGRYTVDLRHLPRPGPYRAALAMFVPPNRTNPEVRVVVHGAHQETRQISVR